jgi:hypothetical protein
MCMFPQKCAERGRPASKRNGIVSTEKCGMILIVRVRFRGHDSCRHLVAFSKPEDVMHPAAKFQFERALREFAQWRAVPQTSDHPHQPAGGNPHSK